MKLRIKVCKSESQVLARVIAYAEQLQSTDHFAAILMADQLQTLKRKALESLKRKSDKGSINISGSEAFVINLVRDLMLDEYGHNYETTVTDTIFLKPFRSALDDAQRKLEAQTKGGYHAATV